MFNLQDLVDDANAMRRYANGVGLVGSSVPSVARLTSLNVAFMLTSRIVSGITLEAVVSSLMT